MTDQTNGSEAGERRECRCGKPLSLHHDSREPNLPRGAILSHPGTAATPDADDASEVANTDGPCEQCGVRYPPWWVDHAIWNRTLGGPDAKGDPGGMLCPNCFLRQAEPVRGAWHITLPVKPATASMGASEACASCGQPSMHRIMLDGVRVPVCLRHLNVWSTPGWLANLLTARESAAATRARAEAYRDAAEQVRDVFTEDDETYWCSVAEWLEALAARSTA
jgi:hypothetical protein